jgi:hypothetical protein
VGLLLQEVGGRRPGGFFLQGEMHALVATILLKSTWFDPLDANTQAKPPDGKFAQVEQGVSRSEGRAYTRSTLVDFARLLARICSTENCPPQTLQRQPGDVAGATIGTGCRSVRLALTSSLLQRGHCR